MKKNTIKDIIVIEGMMMMMMTIMITTITEEDSVATCSTLISSQPSAYLE